MKQRTLFYLIAILLMVSGIAWLVLQWTVFREQPSRENPVPGQSARTLSVPSSSAAAPLPTPGKVERIGPYVSQQAPGFALSTLEGKPVSLEDFRGKVVLLNFWTSWCIPCKEEMPLLQAASEQYQDRGLVVLGINMTYQDERKGIEAFLAETGVTFPILLDEQGTASNDYRILSIPTSFFLDRSGVIRHFQLGAMSAEQLEAYLEEMLP